MAILCKFGVETRSQRCTASFIKYVKEKGLIEYNAEFIERILVHREKDKTTSVDEREEARYGNKIKIDTVQERYTDTMNVCKAAVSQAEEIVYSDKKYEVPKELL